MLAALLAAVLVAACAGNGESDLRAGEERFEAPTFRFVVPEGWSAALDDDPSSDDQVNLFRGRDVNRPVLARIARNRRHGRLTLRQRVRRAHAGADEPSNVVDVGSLQPLDSGVDGEDAWTYGTTYEEPFGGGRQRTISVAFDHGDSEYSIYFESPKSQFDEAHPALRRILETFRFT